MPLKKGKQVILNIYKSKDEFISDFFYELLCTDQPVLTDKQKHIRQLCADTGCCLEDLPRAMVYSKRWLEAIKGIYSLCKSW